jgi:predicted transcriptional regulator
MSTVAEIKSAVEKLSPAERLELFRWLAEHDDVSQRLRTELLEEIDAGLAEAERGELLSGEAVIKRLKERSRGAA